MTYNEEQLAEAVKLVNKELISEQDLVTRVFTHLGIEVGQNDGVYWHSKPFGGYEIKGDFLEALHKREFSFVEEDNSVTTALLYHQGRKENSQQFHRYETDREFILNLRVGGCIKLAERGVVFTPYSEEISSKLQVFQAVVEVAPSVNQIIQRIARDGQGTVYWQELGLGGMRSLAQLFEEFSVGKLSWLALECSSASPFDPRSSVKAQGQTQFYLPEQFQPTLFKVWAKQLADFKGAL
ncbi:MAG: hypothetical protein NT155_01360 [Candidatus Staskawiczbacteria bacterium]|nr:hypothetical protein [Candidatus Staskawiczbacteria bacterium]